MPGLDIFEGDAFGVSSLIASINETTEGQYVPGVIDDLFEEDGVTTVNVWIEKEGDSSTLVPAGERGTPGSAVKKGKRTAVAFKAVHLPTLGGINADEVLNVRAFGSETEEKAVQAVVDKELMRMRKRLEATIAFHRIGAIKGLVLDADGSGVLENIFDKFGLTQQTQAMALTTGATKVRDKIVAAKRKAEDAIGDSGVITGWRCVCGRNFFDALVGHESIEAAYAGWNEAANIMLGDHRQRGFAVSGVEFVEYYGKVGAIEFIGIDDAYLIPIVQGLLITRFAPADYMEVVGTMGVPFYAKQKLRAFDKGVDIEGQTNVLNLSTNPGAIIKLTKV